MLHAFSSFLNEAKIFYLIPASFGRKDSGDKGYVMEHSPTAEQIADMWPKQLGPGPFLVFEGLFTGLDPFMRW